MAPSVACHVLQRTHAHCPITALEFFVSTRNHNDGATPQQQQQQQQQQTYLLSGEDTHLKIYDTSSAASTAPLASLPVFAAQPIHGFALGRRALLVWGGPYVALLPRTALERLVFEQQQQQQQQQQDMPLKLQILRAPDWIYHGAVSEELNLGCEAVVVTARNEVLPLLLGGGDKTLRFGRPRAPPASRPILYSAQVRLEGEGEGEVLVAAGTAFGEIIVWRCRLDGGGGGEEVEVLFVFSGHEGSVFGVDMSPAGNGGETRLLASCSDDRTVRIWDISDGRRRRRRVGKEEKKSCCFTEARETGFGENKNINNNNSSELEATANHVSSRPLAVAMGHVSRIWNVRFSPASATKSLWIYSFGEDATAQRWRLDVAAGDAGSRPDAAVADEDAGPALVSLTHEAVVHRHEGKHIWSSAVLASPDHSGKVLVATGGSDGKIHIAEEVAASSHGESSVMLDISGSEVARNFPSGGGETIPGGTNVDGPGEEADAPPTKTTKKKTKRRGPAVEEEPFLVYALLSDTEMLATTSAGRIFRGSLAGSNMSWTEVALPKPVRDDLRGFHVLRSVGVGWGALLGSASGHIYMYQDYDDTVRQICKLPGKIADIFPLPVDDYQGLWGHGQQQQHPSSTLAVPFVVSTMGSSQARLLVVDPAVGDDSPAQDHPIELDKGFVPTAAGCCQDHLILGSRVGSFLLYKLSEQGDLHRITRIDRPSTKDSVSCIIPLPKKTEHDAPPAPYFLATSRDGRYRIYELSSTNTTATTTTTTVLVHLRHEAAPPLGPMIERALFLFPATTGTDTSPELILVGFRGKDFVVWNETRRRALARVECGGGHRSSAWSLVGSGRALAFVWTKASRTRFFWERGGCGGGGGGDSRRTFGGSNHGREIKAVAACKGGGGLLATGAEDTTVRIWRRDDDDDTAFQCVAVVERHTAGVQCLRWAAAGRYLVSGGGNEELFVWAVTARLAGSAYGGLAVMCEGAWRGGGDGDLRVMGVDVLDDGDDDDGALRLSLVLSSSALKTFRYASGQGFTLLAEGRYTGACLTEVRHLQPAEADDAHHHDVLTAATDGCVAVWRAPAASGEYAMVATARLHQSGIKALDLRALLPPSGGAAAASYAVVTGGDDGAVGYLRLDYRAVFRVVCCRTVAARAHAAAVTGLCVTGIEEAAAAAQDGCAVVRVCTAGNDQRVKAWAMTVGSGGGVERMALVADRYSSVADCGAVEVLDGGREVVVAGVGMEAWRV